MGIIDTKASHIIQDYMMDYGAYVILQRAIPDLRDGLKPVHRRLLYTMHLEKATRFIKSQRIEGTTMSLHPHGSSYGTLVKMAQTDRHANPLVIGEGNFGQYTSRDLAPAAARYTEVKLADIAVDTLSKIKNNLVDFVPNFDGTMTMPEVLPVRYPLILTQAQSGVAYGMASSIPSFNLKELINAMVKFINDGKKTLLVPDFATKGYIVNNKDIFKKINLEGSGSVTLRGKAEIQGNDIIVTELPYSVTRESVIDKIAELSKTKLKEIKSAKDLTGRKGMKLRISCKRGTDMNMMLEKLYQITPLQSTYSTNLNVLVNGSPKNLSVWQVIDEWVNWRKQTLVRGFENDIESMQKKLHFLRGLEKVLLDIDEAINIIRTSKGNMIETNLMKKFEIDEEQAKSVADMKLRNINKDYIVEKIKDIQELEDTIKDYQDIISKDERLSKVLVDDLEDVKNKYAKERSTKLIEVNTEKVKKVKKKIEAVPNFPVKLFVTKEGYVKKFDYNAAEKDQYVKPGDEILHSYDTYNNAELLAFGDDSCCYKIKISDIETSTPKSLGSFIPSLCDVKNVVGTSILDDNHKFVIIAYDNNKVAKIDLQSFNSNRKKLANSLSKTHSVVGILTYKEEGKFIFKTSTTAFKIPTSKYEMKERWTQGVYGPRKGVIQSVKVAE